MYTKKIYFSGGSPCELQEVFDHVPGVKATRAGCLNAGGAEAVGVEVSFDPKKVDLSMLLDILFAVVSPYEPDGQGKCRGSMYRAGVYYTQAEDEPQLEYHLNFIASRGKPPAATCSKLTVNDPVSDQRLARKCYARAERLLTFTPATESHQHYLAKHPDEETFIDFQRLWELGVLKK